MRGASTVTVGAGTYSDAFDVVVGIHQSSTMLEFLAECPNITVISGQVGNNKTSQLRTRW